MRKVIFITQFTSIKKGTNMGRFDYLAEMLYKSNYEVELITTDFYHVTKKHRKLEENEPQNSYKITLIKEPGYKKNVSLKRFYSHHIMGKNLKKYLKNIKEKPDIIYCAVPSLDVAQVAAKYATKNNIRFIVDIQDLWPEAFKMVLNIPIISDIIFYPMKKQADYIYKQANDIVAVSETYLNRALQVNKQYKEKLVTFLGTDLKVFDSYIINDEKERENLIIAYIGTLGHSYDIISIIDAIKILKEKGRNNIKFLVMGDGPLKTRFEEHAKNQQIDVEFTGMLEYKDMVNKLVKCDIAVNPIRRGSAGSIINKVGDYAMASLPVINTQENEEYRQIIEQYKIGFNCENRNAEDIAEKIEILYKDKELREKFGNNNRKLAEEKFDREKTYKRIIEIIERK